MFSSVESPRIDMPLWQGVLCAAWTQRAQCVPEKIFNEINTVAYLPGRKASAFSDTIAPSSRIDYFTDQVYAACSPEGVSSE